VAKGAQEGPLLGAKMFSFACYVLTRATALGGMYIAQQWEMLNKVC